MHRNLCAVSVDLDGIGEYRGLHGLPRRDRGAHAVTDVAVSRLLAFMGELRVPVTLFAIGRDLARERSAEALRSAAQLGARIENHSYAHRYDLSRASPAVIDLEIARASDAIARVTDRRPTGFRAPGYVLSDGLLDGVARAGLAFDASSLPCPAYYLAKLVAMAAIAARGRQTRAILDRPMSQIGPRQPHDRRGVLEIPMAVTRRLRLPVIGTSISLFGSRLVRGCIGDPVISLEFHGIDFLDAGDGLADLASHQWDLRRPLVSKLARFADAIAMLRGAGYAFVPLEAVVRHTESR